MKKEFVFGFDTGHMHRYDTKDEAVKAATTMLQENANPHDRSYRPTNRLVIWESVAVVQFPPPAVEVKDLTVQEVAQK